MQQGNKPAGTAATESSSDVQPTVIRKYANRRLYNTDTASFVTLDDLHTMVKQGEAFVVEDAKTGRDLTCSVLAQIISEEETKGHNMLPLNYLRQVLQAYDAGFGPQFRSYVEHSIDAFAANQKQVVDQMQNLFSGEASSATVQQFMEFGRQNAEMFQRSMQLFTPPLGGRESPPADRTPSGEDAPPRTKEQEIEKLREQLDAIEKRLDRLSDDG